MFPKALKRFYLHLLEERKHGNICGVRKAKLISMFKQTYRGLMIKEIYCSVIGKIVKLENLKGLYDCKNFKECSDILMKNLDKICLMEQLNMKLHRNQDK